MEKVLVTGGSGFVGSALCHHLVQVAGCEVMNLDKLTYASVSGTMAELEGNSCYHFIQLDVCDRTAVLEAFTSFQPDVVMHLAAESHVDRSINGPAAFIKTNIVGTYTMLECTREYWISLPESSSNAQPPTPNRSDFRFHHISTDEVYGSLGEDGLFKETTPYDPHSPYAASKAAGDHLVRAWFHTYGLPVVLSNCSNNYGAFQHPEKLIPLMTILALNGKPLPIYGKGDNIRDWLHVDDHVRALVTVVEKGVVGETYNIGGRNERTNLEVVETICAVLDELRPRHSSGDPKVQTSNSEPHYKDLITFVADRPGHDARYAIDATKLETELGWSAMMDFERGIKQTVQWYLDNESWWRPIHKSMGCNPHNV